jgi:hypothetical protein
VNAVNDPLKHIIELPRQGLLRSQIRMKSREPLMQL